MQHWYSFYLLIPQGAKFHTQRHGCLWFITTVPRALTWSGGWINEIFQTCFLSGLQVDIQAGSKLSRDQTLGPCGSLRCFKKHKKNIKQKHYAGEFYWIRSKVHLVQYSTTDRSQQQIPRQQFLKGVTMQSFSQLSPPHIQSLPRRQLLRHKCPLLAY